MFLQKLTHRKSRPKYSLGHRFSYILTGVVTCIVLVFSTIVILKNFSETEARLKHQLDRTARLAETSLATAVWQLNSSSIDDVLQAIFVDEAIAYARVISEGDILAVKIHPEILREDFAFFKTSPQFITQEVDIQRSDQNIGILQLAISRKNIRQEMIVDIAETVLLTILIVLSISITSIVITRHYILHPLAKLAASAALIANGKLDVPILSEPDLIGSRDEIGELAGAFDEMRERLQHLITHIRSAGKMMKSSSDDIFMAVNQLAAALEQQSAAVLETTATMESMTTTSRKISGNTDAVARMAEQTRTHSQKGVAMAEETIQKMQGIHETNTQFLQKIMKLGDRSEKIGDVIEIINDIADRTKLIAFNAALEAVGAGDTGGKRFNVVAVEIRRLADTIIQSTKEISSNILEIQQGIRELVLSSDVTTNSISEGAQHTETMNDWLRQILEAAIQTTDEARQIAFATLEQQNANEQILLALKEISDGSRQFADAGNQVSTSADEMKRLAKELHDLISNFGEI